MDSYEKEIEYLRERQITPELSQIIKDTKAIMTTVASDNQEVIHDGKGFKELVNNLGSLNWAPKRLSSQPINGAAGVGEDENTMTPGSAMRFDSASYNQARPRNNPVPSISGTSTYKESTGSATKGS